MEAYQIPIGRNAFDEPKKRVIQALSLIAVHFRSAKIVIYLINGSFDTNTLQINRHLVQLFHSQKTLHFEMYLKPSSTQLLRWSFSR